jgi:PAS domain S-box-containing protein
MNTQTRYESKHQADLENMPIGSLTNVGNWSMNIKNKTVIWSDEMYRFYDVNKLDSEIEVQSIYVEDLWKQRKVIKDLLQGKDFEPFEYRVIQSDGSVHIIQIISAEIKFDEKGKPFLVSGSAIDITEKKKSQLKSIANKEALGAEHEMIVIVDKALNITRVNPSFLNKFSLTHKEVINHHVSEFILLGNLESDVIENIICSFEGKSIVSVAMFKMKNVEVSYLESHYYPVYGHDGQVQSVMIKLEDISKTKIFVLNPDKNS